MHRRPDDVEDGKSEQLSSAIIPRQHVYPDFTEKFSKG